MKKKFYSFLAGFLLLFPLLTTAQDCEILNRVHTEESARLARVRGHRDGDLLQIHFALFRRDDDFFEDAAACRVSRRCD